MCFMLLVGSNQNCLALFSFKAPKKLEGVEFVPLLKV